jgi:hypothetical protein
VPAIPAFGRLKQENLAFEASLGYTVSSREVWDKGRGEKGEFLERVFIQW